MLVSRIYLKPTFSVEWSVNSDGTMNWSSVFRLIHVTLHYGVIWMKLATLFCPVLVRSFPEA
jgi:hypothetical protein